MSLKINVIYKGIIYRVKGIKVLCSVVLAVIILLVAIVGMGVWMLINVYDDRSTMEVGNIPDTEGIKQTNKLTNNIVRPPSIDFNESDDIVPSDILVHSFRHRGKPDAKTEESLKSTEASTLPSRISEDEGMEDSLQETPLSLRTTISKNIFNAEREKLSENMFVATTQMPKYISGKSEVARDRLGFYDLEYPFKRVRIKEPSQPKHIEATFGDISSNDWNPTLNPTVTTTKFSRRQGIPAKGNLTYFGPPVVGYGSNPYEKYTQERVDEYNNFWRTYTGTNSHSNPRKEYADVKRKGISRDDNLRPHLRGLRPTGFEYDIPVRPDAQTPLKVEIRKGPSSESFISSPAEAKSGVRPLTTPSPSRTAIRPTVFGPVQSLYDYSKKLAASLLSFGSKSPEQIRNSSEKFAEYGINLIQNHNQIFQDVESGPLNRLVTLIPNTERLATLDPFELSLITWTFLDFWEFLIEKVGALSDEDLSLLQKRLQNLRKKKDDAMTRVFVNETLSKYSTGKQRSISHTEDPENNLAQITEQGKADVKINMDNKGVNENTSSATQASAPQREILGNLFPTLLNNDTGNYKQNKTNTHPQRTALLRNEEKVINATIKKLIEMLQAPTKQNFTLEGIGASSKNFSVEGRSSTWDPLGIFTSAARMEFMQFAVKVLFNFGKVYLKKSYALDCSMLLFCKDLNQDSRKGGLDAMAAKLKSVGLKVLTESEKELREKDTLGEVWRSVTAWSPLQCDAMFPRCDGPKALEIVNEVALGSN